MKNTKKDDNEKKFEWRYDPLAKAGYLRLTDKKVDFTTELVEGHVMIDRDKDGDVIGVEIIFPDIDTDENPLPCPHGRMPYKGSHGWRHCPHCLGINDITHYD